MINQFGDTPFVVNLKKEMHDFSPTKYLPGLKEAIELSAKRDEHCKILAEKSRKHVAKIRSIPVDASGRKKLEPKH